MCGIITTKTAITKQSDSTFPRNVVTLKFHRLQLDEHVMNGNCASLPLHQQFKPHADTTRESKTTFGVQITLVMALVERAVFVQAAFFMNAPAQESNNWLADLSLSVLVLNIYAGGLADGGSHSHETHTFKAKGMLFY